MNNDFQVNDCDEDSEDSMSSKMTAAVAQSHPPSSQAVVLPSAGSASAAAAADIGISERDNYNVDQITECWKCGSTFNTRKQLQKHLKEHAVDLPFKCFLCDASFEDRAECLVHIATRHRGEWDTLRDKNRIGDRIEAFAASIDKVSIGIIASGLI